MDPQLIARAQAGDREAFAQIAEASYDRCYEIARRVIGESNLALDATQQAMLAIWRDLPKLREASRFEAWSYRVVVNACYLEIKRAKRVLPDVGVADDRVIVDDESGTVLDRDQIERAFARQKLEHRVVLVLRYYLDLSIEEVAETLDIPVGTVKSRSHHALKSMRAALDADARPPRDGAAAISAISSGPTSQVTT